MLTRPTTRTLVLAALISLLAACASTPPPQTTPDMASQLQQRAPIRFLLTFDDGPARGSTDNSSLQILRTLDQNPVQPGIKAVFFAQTRSWHAGETEAGRAILRQEVADGQVLGFHTATPFHADHALMKPQDLEASLNNGIADLTSLRGSAPDLVRPPFWAYNAQTFAAYQQHGLHMLLTDLSANDGKIYGYHISLHRRGNLLNMLAHVRDEILIGKLPVVDGAIPVVVTFHDINGYTADHMAEYLQILIDTAHELQMPTTTRPFYDEAAAVDRAAVARAVKDGSAPKELPGVWQWIWGE
ncbi:peptidoglycan/xylan/chitin deacetylase (PgdA/CDA1 family) [Silvimonas terrae]|uniref:Peptidoglycan/xylan/chitin deacetylase (PgdA/CDA1 family) n=1 Tax=Silvimonas terrae TaxID=300266 RepID=A0A840RH63_9NEIS|nr:polysaccharide deacetylase family protein [Silvimonas terrae]MBB5191613.1 peptidoglycan/xylan/chitin deacetylase (PgdA/CDA1 family) [Silvimonas terrae]